MLIYFWRGLLLGGAAAAQPGPIQVFLLSLTLRNGWRQAMIATLAPLISDGPIILLVLLILTRTPDWFLNMLQIGGGIFLIYLSWRVFSARVTAVTPDALPPHSAWRGLLQTVVVNLLNPNPYIFWSTVAGPIFLDGWRLAPGHGLGFLFGFYGSLIGGFMAFVVLFATTQRLEAWVVRTLNVLAAAVLLILGLSQLGIGFLKLS